MADDLQVRVVAADREVWTGSARMVLARTLEGEIGILPGHEPLLGVLANGVVRIRVEDGSAVEAAVHGGFISVADGAVDVLGEAAELAEDIDVERARRSLDESQAQDVTDELVKASIARAQTRLAVAGAR